MNTELRNAYLNELSSYRILKNKKEIETAWVSLERAHIISQFHWREHFSVHLIMFIFSLQTLNGREVFGQIPRLLLAIPASLTKKAPFGNSGRSNVSMFKTQTIPNDLKHLIQK